MNRDPLYQALIAGLSGRLDPHLFERCASSLLANIFPGLVPVVGGTDAGMDGAIPDGEGRAFPLIVTTALDGTGNLRRNLRRYKSENLPRRKAVFATSRALSERKRRNLEGVAEEEGFTLIQIFDQTAVADLMYRRPEWSLELLGITGQAPALSKVPTGRRRLGGGALVGRGDDLAWLSSRDGDAVIYGQPGSGKTALLRALTDDNAALFVVDDDIPRVTNAVRELAVTRVIVDDAHGRRDFLRQLVEWRRQTGSDLKIVATAWPGADEVAVDLGLSAQDTRELLDLTRDELVTVVAGCGVESPRYVVREIVTQADGKPGLASTLAFIFLGGGSQDLALGDALARDVRVTFGEVVGPEGLSLLAMLALADEAGLSLDFAAQLLGLSLVAAHRLATGLAAGGIVRSNRNGSLTARPVRLRQALVRDAFFGNIRLPLDHAISALPPDGVALALIGARAVGADVPRDLLINQVRTASTTETWVQYAWLGPWEAAFALGEHPELATVLSKPGLTWSPDTFIPSLLAAAVGDNRALNSHPEHPLRKLQDWVRSPLGPQELSRKRSALFDQALAWLNRGGDDEVATKALTMALDPGLEGHDVDPGGGRTFTISRGMVPDEEIRHLLSLWRQLAPSLSGLRTPALRHLIDVVDNWTYPGRHDLSGKRVSSYNAIEQGAREIVSDLLLAATERPGILRRLRPFLDELGLDSVNEHDSVFETLFPDDPWDVETHDDIVREQMNRATYLAEAWATQEPAACAALLARAELDARSASSGSVYPRYSPQVCHILSETVESPTAWLRALVKVEATADLLSPFLQQAIRTQPSALWLDLAHGCLETPGLVFPVVDAFLLQDSFPEALVEAALSKLGGFENLVQTYFVRGQVSSLRAAQILKSAPEGARLAAAVGEWCRKDPRGAVRPELSRVWRAAILDCSSETEEFWVGDILAQSPQLAHDWLRRQFHAERRFLFLHNNTAAAGAVRGLDSSGRTCILATVPDDWSYDGLCKALVADGVDAYRQLLSATSRRGLHFGPLQREPDTVFAAFAMEALAAGYSIEDLVHSPDSGGWMWTGPESSRWAARRSAWEQLKAHPDSRIQQLAALGVRSAIEQELHALKEEHEEAVRGI